MFPVLILIALFTLVLAARPVQKYSHLGPMSIIEPFNWSPVKRVAAGIVFGDWRDLLHMMAAFLVHTGKAITTNKLKAAGTEPLNLAWGTGTGVLVSDVNLLIPSSEARTAGTSSKTTTTRPSDTYTVTGTITATGSRAITEIALFDGSTASANTTTAAGGSSIGSAGGTGVNLTSATGFPTSGNYYVQQLNEVMLVTGGQSTTSLTVTRAQLGSTASATHAAGEQITASGGGGDAAVTGAGGTALTSMFIHADFSVINLVINDSIAFTVNTQYT